MDSPPLGMLCTLSSWVLWEPNAASNLSQAPLHNFSSSHKNFHLCCFYLIQHAVPKGIMQTSFKKTVFETMQNSFTKAALWKIIECLLYAGSRNSINSLYNKIHIVGFLSEGKSTKSQQKSHSGRHFTLLGETVGECCSPGFVKLPLRTRRWWSWWRARMGIKCTVMG